MSPRLYTVAALALALVPSTVAAQGYTIKLKQPAPNEPIAVKRSDESKLEFRLTDAAGNAVQSRKDARALTLVFVETGYERAEGASAFTSLKRDYQKAERTFDGVKETLSYQGKAVVIDKKEGKFSFRAGDDPLDGKDAEELDDEFSRSERKSLNPSAWLPNNPVQVGDTWKIGVTTSTREFAKNHNCQLDETRSSGTGKLLKAFQKDGRQFGVLEANVELVVTHLLDPKTGAKTPCQDGRIRLKIALTGCIDGTREQSETRTTQDSNLRATFSAGNMKLNLNVTLHVTLDESRTETPR